MVKTGISLDSVKNNNKSQILKILQKNGAIPFNTPYSLIHASRAYQFEYAGLCL